MGIKSLYLIVLAFFGATISAQVVKYGDGVKCFAPTICSNSSKSNPDWLQVFPGTACKWQDNLAMITNNKELKEFALKVAGWFKAQNTLWYKFFDQKLDYNVAKMLCEDHASNVTQQLKNDISAPQLQSRLVRGNKNVWMDVGSASGSSCRYFQWSNSATQDNANCTATQYVLCELSLQ